MSEDRLARIEAALGELRRDMATKADLAELRRDMATKADLAELRNDMATKADFAGVARNVDVEALARLTRQSLTETAAVRDELRVVSALAQQLVGAVSGLTNLLSRLVEQQTRTADRVRALEEQHP